jgi:hypothetical protein
MKGGMTLFRSSQCGMPLRDAPLGARKVTVVNYGSLMGEQNRHKISRVEVDPVTAKL